MKYLFALVLLLVPFTANAADIYTNDPQCAVIKNETTKNAFVAIRTDFYVKPDGKKSYYEEVLHLDPGNMQQVCAKGPFLPGYKVHLIIKSFFPLFDCQTRLEGEIPIRDKPSETDSAGRDVYAVCVD